MWSVEGTLIQSVSGAAGGGEVSCVDVRGARAAAGGGRALRLFTWRTNAGWQLASAEPRAHRYGVTCAHFTDSGTLLASAGIDGIVRLWGARRELTARASLAAPGATSVRALAWGGARLAVGHDDGACRIWLPLRATLLAVLRAHDGALHAVAMPAYGALLLTACTEGVLKLHDTEEVIAAGCDGSPALGTRGWVDGAHDLGALCAATSADGRLVATGGHDARVRLWMTIRKQKDACLTDLLTLEGHEGAVTCLSWSRGRELASCSLDRTARIWCIRGAAGDESEGADDVAADCLLLLHAHDRYLTCLSLDAEMRFLVTGSNDKSFRMWSLGEVTLEEPLEPPCVVLEHFALGDLEGIGPVSESLTDVDAAVTNSEANCEWTDATHHTAAINSLQCWDDCIATACSDGVVRVFRVQFSESEGDGGTSVSVTLVHSLAGHRYPAMAAAWGSGGQMLLSCGLDGEAVVWDVESGISLRRLRAGAGASVGGGVGGGAGCGGVRGAAVAARRPPLLLLATDDNDAPLWVLSDSDPNPMHVYSCGGLTTTCCGWTADGRAAATGGGAAGGGELRLHAAPPAPRTLLVESHAHDLGVESLQFSPSAAVLGFPDDAGYYVLASTGGDMLIKIWLVHFPDTQESSCGVWWRVVRAWVGHGGTSHAARWSRCGALLATGGGDGYARVWAPRAARSLAALPAPGAAAVTAIDFLHTESSLNLCMGTLDGSLSIWRLPTHLPELSLNELGGDGSSSAGGSGGAGAVGDGEDEDLDTRGWGAPGVARWIRDYVTRVPGEEVSASTESAILAAAAELTGARLLDDDIELLIQLLGYGDEDTQEDDDLLDLEDHPSEEVSDASEHAALRQRLRDEIEWLRREPPSLEVERNAPHALRCPLTHNVLREPTRAADGFTYERRALHEWFHAAGGAISWVSGCRLASSRLSPNYRLRKALQHYLQTNQ